MWKADAMTHPTTEQAKKLAKLLRDDLAVAGFSIPHSLALELIAHQLNAKDWNVLAAKVGRSGRSASPEVRPGVPVLRVVGAGLVANEARVGLGRPLGPRVEQHLAPLAVPAQRLPRPLVGVHGLHRLVLAPRARRRRDRIAHGSSSRRECISAR